MCNFFHLLSEILIDLSFEEGVSPTKQSLSGGALPLQFGGEIATPLFGVSQ
jgi:hypothetical protein